jgi:pimeloyl-ACP methyl ester carboxylesterase
MPDGSIVLIPGVGADSGIYEPQRRRFGDRLVVPPWIDPLHHDEPLADYARRLGDTIRHLPGLRKPFAIGGISFGGMLAAEIADDRPQDVSALLLIGSCTSRRQITAAFRLAATWGQVIPDGLAKGLLNRVAPVLFEALEGVTGEHRRLLDEVAYRTDTKLLKWAGRAVRAWTPGPAPVVPTFHAHGRLDRVVPVARIDFDPIRDLIIPDGRHLIHLTHADPVNDWIDRVSSRPA